jgi:glucosamine kinase
MIAIAESGSTKCDWVILDSDGNEILRHKTNGFNPYFHSSSFVTEALEADSTMVEIRSSVTALYFYGAGCSTDDLKNQIASGLKAFFTKAKVLVDHDLLAAAYSLYQGAPLISCILGTGSNSCFFDGQAAHETVPALGFILGDEASGCYIGKRFLTDYLYERLPADLHEKFQKEFGLGWCEIRPKVYNSIHANVYLSSFMPFIYQNRDSEYVQQIVNDSIRAFVEVHVKSYPQFQEVEIGFVGSIAYLFQDNLRKELINQGCTVGRIIRGPVDNLVQYHIAELKVLDRAEFNRQNIDSKPIA